MIKNPPASAGVHRLEPCSGKIPHAIGQLSPCWYQTTEPESLELAFRNKRSHPSERPVCRSEERPCSLQLEEAREQRQRSMQPKLNKETNAALIHAMFRVFKVQFQHKGSAVYISTRRSSNLTCEYLSKRTESGS